MMNTIRRLCREIRNEWRLAVKRDRARKIMAEVARIKAERGYPNA